MDNNVFNKRLKVGVTIFASIVVVLAIVWFGTRAKANTDSCFNEDNYYDALSIDEVVDMIYDVYEIPGDPKDFCSLPESYLQYENLYEAAYGAQCIKSYQTFLSDESDCNKGKEPLKTFICNINTNRAFLESRLSLNENERNSLAIDSIPSFKFHCEWRVYMLNSRYISNKKEIDISNRFYSWSEIGTNRAVFRRFWSNDPIDTYTFNRIKGKWYLTEYWKANYDEY